jgi:hypothetical protein
MQCRSSCKGVSLALKSHVKLISKLFSSPLTSLTHTLSSRIPSYNQGRALSFLGGGGKGSGPNDSGGKSPDEEPEDSSKQPTSNVQYPTWMKVRRHSLL